jgi:hypothetical protein
MPEQLQKKAPATGVGAKSVSLRRFLVSVKPPFSQRDLSIFVFLLLAAAVAGQEVERTGSPRAREQREFR